MADDKSSAGSFLGGLAALIVAVATLYATLHHNPNPPSQSTNTTASNSMQDRTNEVPARESTSHSRSNPNNRVQDRSQVSQTPPPLVDISGYWSGLSGPGHQLLRVHVESNGQISGQFKRECRVDRSSDSDYLVIAANSTWDGKNLEIHIPPDKYLNQPGVITATLVDGDLVGTYHVLYDQSVVFHKGQDACGV